MEKFVRKFINLFLLSALILTGGFGFMSEVKAEVLSDPPQIITRAEWEADEALKTWEPEYSQDTNNQAILKAKVIVVHHTASVDLTPDSDGTGQYKAKVRAIYKWHVTNATWEDEVGVTQRGFGDIGYHYLIDPNGNIYQGRAGANGVIGAHVYGGNRETIGIGVIGTYGAEINGQYIAHPLNSKLTSSLQNLIAWLAAANDIDLTQKVKIKVLGEEKIVYGLTGHKDLRPTKCPGENLYQYLATLRAGANSLAKSFRDYLYQMPASPKVYLLRDGLRLGYDSLDSFKAQGNTYKKIVSASISRPLLDIFLDRPFIKYPDGTLLRDRELATIYLLENGRKRALRVTPQEFEGLGFNWEDVKVTIKEDLALYLDGPPVKYAPDNTLIKGPDYKVYLTRGGRKHWITSGKLFTILGYSWKKVKEISRGEFENYLEGEIVSYPDGTLAKGTAPAVYLIENGKKREFTSATIFETLGYRWKDIEIIPDDELALYPPGERFRYPEGSLVRAKNSSTVYLIKDGQRHPFLSAQNFLTNQYQWQKVLEIEPIELVFHQEGSPVGYPEGSLVQAEGNFRVYAIKNGQPEWIKSEAEFKKAGYLWSQIKKVFIGEFAALYPQVVAIFSPTPSQPSQPVPEPETPSTQAEPLIRIGLWQVPQGQTVLISANGPYSIYDKNNNLIATKKAGQNFSVNWSTNTWQKFVPASEQGIMEVVNFEDRPSWKKELNYNRFRGNIEIRYSAKSQALWVINELPLESYLKGIAEALSSDPTEYQKAFAIMARSYALFHIQGGGKYPDEIFHLNSTANDQLYKGYVFEQLVFDTLVKAIEQTRGLFLTYQGKIVRALYSSDSGGQTKSACEKWGSEFCSDDYGYLKGGILDPPETAHDPAKVAASHGVGMSCIGARALAKQGKTYEEILKHYYLGVEIEQKY